MNKKIHSCWIWMIVMCLRGHSAGPADLAGMLRDPDEAVRVRGVYALEDLGEPGAVPRIAACLADPHPRVRYRALRALQGIKQEYALAWMTETGLRHPDPLIRAGVAEALGRTPCQETGPPLVEAFRREGHPAVLAAMARALGEQAFPDAFPSLEAGFARLQGEGRAAALEAMAIVDPSQTRHALERALEDGNGAVRIAALSVLTGVNPATAPQVLSRAIGDRDWRVRVAAIEAATDVRTREAVGILIARLPQEHGRLRQDLLWALNNLTGKSLGLDARAWKGWWDAVQGTFTIPKPEEKDSPGATRRRGNRTPGGDVPPDADEHGQVVERRPAPDMLGTTGLTTCRFYNVPIFSDRVAFVLDCSGSMREPTSAKDPASGKWLTRADVARREILSTIGRLEPRVGFNIILLGCARDGTYAVGKKVWQPHLVPASPASRAEAARFMEHQEPGGWTNIYDALALAMRDPEVDTIFLVSDGGASKGQYVTPAEIFDRFAVQNHYRKVMIHSIEIYNDSDDNTRLMRGLAALSRGTYRKAGESAPEAGGAQQTAGR